jgi:hypothetical protein
VALSGAVTGVLSTNTVVGNPASSQTQTDPSAKWTDGYAFTPNANLQAVSVRTYYGTKVVIWTDAGVPLASQNVTGSSGSWVETPLDTPIILSAGITYRVSVLRPAGVTGYLTRYYGDWPTTFPNGTVGQTFYSAYGDNFPNQISGSGLGPFLDLRYTVSFSNSVPVSPTSSGAFVNGVWNGNITVSQGTTNVVLKADDGAGHVALSTPFNLITPIRLLSPHRLAGGQFQFTVSSAPGLHLEILASSNFVKWTTNTTLINTTGTTNITDSTTGLSKRFYRAHQLP